MVKCEDEDLSCESCKGSCDKEATTYVKRIDDNVEMFLCNDCAKDAIESEMFVLVS